MGHRHSVQTGGPINVGLITCNGRDRMRLSPEVCRDGKWIDALFVPPGALIATPMQLTMMQPANGNGELVAALCVPSPAAPQI